MDLVDCVFMGQGFREMSHNLNNKALGLFIYFSEKEELETDTRGTQEAF